MNTGAHNWVARCTLHGAHSLVAHSFTTALAFDQAGRIALDGMTFDHCQMIVEFCNTAFDVSKEYSY